MIFIFVKYFEKRSQGQKVVYDSTIYLFMGKKITEE